MRGDAVFRERRERLEGRKFGEAELMLGLARTSFGSTGGSSSNKKERRTVIVIIITRTTSTTKTKMNSRLSRLKNLKEASPKPQEVRLPSTPLYLANTKKWK